MVVKMMKETSNSVLSVLWLIGIGLGTSAFYLGSVYYAITHGTEIASYISGRPVLFGILTILAMLLMKYKLWLHHGYYNVVNITISLLGLVILYNYQSIM